jgi:TM2 domain-containing membrane protein YozV
MKMSAVGTKRGLVAFLLSLMIPGLGQFYNAHLTKAILLYTSLAVTFISTAALGLLHSFKVPILHVFLVWTLALVAAIDALSTALRHVKADSISKQGWRSYVLAAVGVASR